MSFDRRPFRHSGLAAALAGLLLANGCAAARPSTSVEGSPAPNPSPSRSSPSLVSAAPTATADPLPTVRTSPQPVVLPPVAAAPAGPWSRVAWLAAGSIVPVGPNVAVYGWSGGFVAVASSAGDTVGAQTTPTVITTTASDDGMRWSVPRTIDTSGIDGALQIAGVVHGSAGLLLVGETVSGTCGGPPWISALWSSSDGRAWRRLELPKDFVTGRAETLEGGPAGFIATGLRNDGTTAGIWASPDGTSWRSLPVPRVSRGTVVVSGATSVAGGFVLSGAVLGPEGCGGATALTPSLWWSSDGAQWTRDTIAETAPADDAGMSVHRISDHALVAIETRGSTADIRAWVSADGRSWTRVGAPPETIERRLLSNGRSAAIVADPESGAGPLEITAVGADMRLTTVAQIGSGPVAGPDSVPWTLALGSTGILVVTVDGRAAWLGVPTRD